MMYTANSKRKRPEEQATVRIVAIKGRNELSVFAQSVFAQSVFATNTDLKPKAIRKIFRKGGL